MIELEELGLVSHFIVAHNGRYFKFINQDGRRLTAQVCYWKGVIILPKWEGQRFRAFVQQRYAPYQRIWAKLPLYTQTEALNWAASQLDGLDQTAE